MSFIDQMILLFIPLICTGFVSGFLAGLLGVGGGIVIVPIVAFALETTGLHTSTPMHVAVASSLAVIVPTSIISARAHFNLGNVDMAVIRKLGPFVFIGAFGGAVVVNLLDNHSLKIIFGLLASLIGAQFLVKVIILRDGLPSVMPRGVMGVLIGLMSALVGIGGGSLTVPTLLACKWDMHKAVGTSALMGLVIAIPGVVGLMIVGHGAVQDLSYMVGYVWLPAVLIISAGAYFSTPLGAQIGTRINKDQLRRIFGVFLIIVGGRLAYSGFLAAGL